VVLFSKQRPVVNPLPAAVIRQLVGLVYLAPRREQERAAKQPHGNLRVPGRAPTATASRHSDKIEDERLFEVWIAKHSADGSYEGNWGSCCVKWDSPQLVSCDRTVGCRKMSKNTAISLSMSQSSFLGRLAISIFLRLISNSKSSNSESYLSLICFLVIWRV
jgi:hypothetical protein